MARNRTVGIVGNGTSSLIPNLTTYREEIDIWIGADRGALSLLQQNLPVDIAIGDFDSVNQAEFNEIKRQAKEIATYPVEKNATDLELAIEKAFELKAEKIYLFAVTGTRKDHELMNIQMLYKMIQRGITGVIIDRYNYLEMTLPGEYQLVRDEYYPIISFIPFSKVVTGLTLKGFYYPLVDQTIQWGESLTISNKLSEKSGSYSYKEGILMLIKSREEITL